MAWMIWLDGNECEEFLEFAKANNVVVIDVKHTVDEASGSVIQLLEGALSLSDVGKIVTREMRVEEDRLIIQLATTSADGEPITRTLSWLRSA